MTISGVSSRVVSADCGRPIVVGTAIEITVDTFFLCPVHLASRYIRVIKTNLMHYLSSVYFVSQPLRVSGIFIVHHQEVYCIYIYIYIYIIFIVPCIIIFY